MAFSGPRTGPAGNVSNWKGQDDARITDCYYCGERVAGSQYDAHLRVCPRKRDLENKNQFRGGGNRGGLRTGKPVGGSAIAAGFGNGGVNRPPPRNLASPPYGGRTGQAAYKSSAIRIGNSRGDSGSASNGSSSTKLRMWQCEKCTFYNDWSNDICVICNQGIRPPSNNQWRCPICTFINENGRKSCHMCGSRPPPNAAGGSVNSASSNKPQSSIQPSKIHPPPARPPPAGVPPRRAPPSQQPRIEPLGGSSYNRSKPSSFSSNMRPYSVSPSPQSSISAMRRQPPPAVPSRISPMDSSLSSVPRRKPLASSSSALKPLGAPHSSNPSNYSNGTGANMIPAKRNYPPTGVAASGQRDDSNKLHRYSKDNDGSSGRQWLGSSNLAALGRNDHIAPLDKPPPPKTNLFSRNPPSSFSNGRSLVAPVPSPLASSKIPRGLIEPPKPKPKPASENPSQPLERKPESALAWRSNELRLGNEDPKPPPSDLFKPKPKAQSPPVSVQTGVDELNIGGSARISGSVNAPPPPKPMVPPPKPEPKPVEPPPLEEMKVDHLDDQGDQKESVATSPMEILDPPPRRGPPPKPAQDPDEATARLIREMMQAEMCSLCTSNQGYDVGVCGHRICRSCGKDYLVNGILKHRWSTELVRCPIGKCKTTMPEYLWRRVGLSETTFKRIQEMQEQLHMRNMKKDLVQCPKCKTAFAGEAGQIQAHGRHAKEVGVDGKVCSYEALKHKAANRYRCPRCKPPIDFCKLCGKIPYHLGFDCESYKRHKKARKCRFCDEPLLSSNTARPEYGLGPGLSNTVCNTADCIEKRAISCDHIHPCGHLCHGVRGEKQHLKCLREDCQADKSKGNPSEDYCNICWVEALGQAPTIILECRHLFHYSCVREKLGKKWPGARITFNFLECPLCKREISHPDRQIRATVKKITKLKRQVEKKAVERLAIEKCEHDKRLKDPKSKYYRNATLFAMDRFAFYKCHKCRQPYFGGMRRCEEAGADHGQDGYNKEHLICGSCASGPNSKTCKVHGKQFITYKCKFCCNIGRWFCWGNTHFCDKCHSRQEKGDYLNRKPISALPKCPGAKKCPLAERLNISQLEHPPNGTKNFSLGCIVCLRR